MSVSALTKTECVQSGLSLWVYTDTFPSGYCFIDPCNELSQGGAGRIYERRCSSCGMTYVNEPGYWGVSSCWDCAASTFVAKDAQGISLSFLSPKYTDLPEEVCLACGYQWTDARTGNTNRCAETGNFTLRIALFWTAIGVVVLALGVTCYKIFPIVCRRECCKRGVKRRRSRVQSILGTPGTSVEMSTKTGGEFGTRGGGEGEVQTADLRNEAANRETRGLNIVTAESPSSSAASSPRSRRSDRPWNDSPRRNWRDSPRKTLGMIGEFEETEPDGPDESPRRAGHKRHDSLRSARRWRDSPRKFLGDDSPRRRMFRESPRRLRARSTGQPPNPHEGPFSDFPVGGERSRRSSPKRRANRSLSVGVFPAGAARSRSVSNAGSVASEASDVMEVMVASLVTLKELRAAGALTDKEFRTAKRRVLRGAGIGPGTMGRFGFLDS